MKTCSKENGARLVELGVTVESYFVHHANGVYESRLTNKAMVIAPAYTAGELLDVLKKYIYHCDLAKLLGDYMQGDMCIEDILSERIIYDLENGHITKEEINEG
jgi:hypothetical protein